MARNKLPQRVLAKAFVTADGEYAWPEPDFEEAVSSAKRAGLACLGGQPQFEFPEGICELYWLDYDSAEREPDEAWKAYVARSISEVIEGFQRVCRTTDFKKEALEWDFISEKAESAGVDPLEHLWFVAYFCGEDE